VLVNRASRHPCFDQINWDNTSGVTLAVEHMIRLGHRRIALVTGPDNRKSTAERIAGYRQALAAFGLPDNADYYAPGDYTSARSQWEETARRILAMSPRPTAAIASDDAVAAFVMRTLQRTGVRVPEDIAVIGIDDQPFASYLNPALTTVRLPIPQAGEMAVTMLMGRLAGSQDEGRHVMLPCELIVRESCGASLGPRSFA
jgi:DNA-binding LacI/PurR family transcriptional regulator